MCISVSWSSIQSEINHLYTTYNSFSHQPMKVARLSLQEQDKVVHMHKHYYKSMDLLVAYVNCTNKKYFVKVCWYFSHVYVTSHRTIRYVRRHWEDITPCWMYRGITNYPYIHNTFSRIYKLISLTAINDEAPWYCIRVSGSGCLEVVGTQNPSHLKDWYIVTVTQTIEFRGEHPWTTGN